MYIKNIYIIIKASKSVYCVLMKSEAVFSL